MSVPLNFIQLKFKELLAEKGLDGPFNKILTICMSSFFNLFHYYVLYLIVINWERFCFLVMDTWFPSEILTH
jgi:hypothetical protein